MIKRKLVAIALTTTMLLSLVGCGKKNFDGKYTAEVDETDSLVEVIESYYGSTDFDWSGTVIEPYHLELSEGEYTYYADVEVTRTNIEKFMNDNIEDYLWALVDETVSSDDSLAGLSHDELLETYESANIWELWVGLSSKEEVIADFMEIFADDEEMSEREDGEYEIDGDVVTLNGVAIMYDDGDEGEGWPLTYEDGDLVGSMYMDEDGEESIDVRFVRDAE